MENRQKALGIIANILDMDAEKLALETVIQEIPDWDSGAFLAMISELDEEFQLKIPIEKVIGELANAKTIGDFLSLLGL